MQTVEREMLVSNLEFLKLGISETNIIEQSDSFVFENGAIHTYDDEIACCVNACGIDVSGAVPASMLTVLREMGEETVEIGVIKNQFVIKGKRATAKLNLDPEVKLPFSNVDEPKKWKPLPPVFADAVGFVQPCAEKSNDVFKLTCVHITATGLEAANHREICRYKVDTGLTRNLLITKNSIKHVIDFGATKWSVTDNWLHFKNDVDFVMSIRIHQDDTYSIPDDWFTVKGAKLTMPAWFESASRRAAIFSGELGKDENLLRVALKEGKARLSSVGATGSFDEVGSTSYKGRNFAFMINPDLLRRVVEQKMACKVNTSHLKIDTGTYEYVALLELEE